MKVITKRPIYTEPTSNCCGMSGADGTYSNCCGMSGADGSLKDLIAMGKEYLSEQTADRKESRQDAVKNIRNDRTIAKQTKRTNRDTKRTDRQVNRSSRKEARFTRRQDRKAKRNSKKIALIKVQGKERYFFPLSRVRLGKKKYKDGTEVSVKAEDQITVTTPSGETLTFDRKEVAKAMGIAPEAVTQALLQSKLYPIPKKETEEQDLNKEVNQGGDETVYAVPPPEKSLETGNDGEIYLSSDLQSTDEPTKDVKDEENGLSKTQKIVLWSAGIVVVGIIGYLIYQSATKSKTVI